MARRPLLLPDETPAPPPAPKKAAAPKPAPAPAPVVRTATTPPPIAVVRNPVVARSWTNPTTWTGTEWGVAAVGSLAALYGVSRLIVTRREQAR